VLIPRPRIPTKCSNSFISSEVNFLNRRKPLAYNLKEDYDYDGGGGGVLLLLKLSHMKN
jgi:hypothetical protein